MCLHGVCSLILTANHLDLGVLLRYRTTPAYLNQTFIFDGYVARILVKDEHPYDMCYYEIGKKRSKITWTQFLTTASLPLEVYYYLLSYGFYISNTIWRFEMTISDIHN